MNPLEQLKSVLCDPKGKCCIAGSNEDRAIVDRALQALAEQEQVALAQQVMGCFHAAEIEGLTAALANTTDEHLKDLVERRLMHALYAAQEVERNSK